MPRGKARKAPQELDELPPGSDPMKAAIEYGMNAFNQLAKELLPLGSESESNEWGEKMVTKYKMLVKAKILHDENAKIVAEVAKQCATSPDEVNEKEILKACDSIKTISEKRVSDMERNIKHDEKLIRDDPDYQQFEKIVKDSAPRVNASRMATDSGEETEHLDEDEDEDSGEGVDDEEPARELIPTIDPISKKVLRDPVRCKICKHIFSKGAFMQMVKQRKKQALCPIAGCQNKKLLEPSDLEESEELTEAVKKEVAKQNKRGRR